MDLRAQRTEKLKQARAIVEQAGGHESLTDEQLDQVEALNAEADELESQIKAQERRQAAAAATQTRLGAVNPRKVAEQPLPKPSVTDPREGFRDDPKCGFARERDFYQAVVSATRTGKVDERLRFLAAAGSDEQGVYSDPHGGFLVPSGFRTNVLSVPSEKDPTIGRTMLVPMESPVVEWPARVDKNHTTSVSGGLTATRKAEAVAATASRQQYERVKLSVDDLFLVAIATERLIADSPISIAALLETGAADEFAAKVFKEKLYGSGVGEYMGILNSPCLVSFNRTASGNDIEGTDLVAMLSRCYGYGDAIWIANHDTIPDLAAAHLPGTNGDQYLWKPGDTTLLGRPIFFSEFAKSKGTKGDIILGSWREYLEGSYQAPGRAESIHVRFLEHERVFKFWLRNAGAPWWSAALTPAESSDTLSPFVVLNDA